MKWKEIKNFCKVLGLILPLLLLSIALNAQPDNTPLYLDTLVHAEGLNVVWDIEWMGEEQIIYTELEGNIGKVNLKTGQQKQLYSFSATARELQAGLMGMALHPQFSEHPLVYVANTYYIGDSIFLQLVELKYESKEERLNFSRTLMDRLPSASVNAGGRLITTPDQKIFLSVGEGDNDEAAQDSTTLAGKILRLNLDGSIPKDNPIPGSPIWAVGLRNAQGLTWGRGRLYGSEHGTLGHDELNLIERSGNYGWPLVGGNCPEEERGYCDRLNLSNPIWDWSPAIAPCGIAFYDGERFGEWKNSVLVTSLKNEALQLVRLAPDGRQLLDQETYLTKVGGRLRDVLVSPEGRVFVSTTNGDSYGKARDRGDQIIELIRAESVVFAGATERSESLQIQLDSTLLDVHVLAEGLRIPWEMEWGYDGKLWFNNRGGALRRMDLKTGQITKLYQIPDVYESDDNSGTQGMCFHPDFPKVPHIYMHYNYELYKSRLLRLTFDVEQDTITAKEVLLDELRGHRSHNGSRLAFGPDGMLYFALGDAYKKRLPQKLDNPNGKILRLQPDGSIPDDNPIAGSAIWSYGHRNPQGLIWAKGILYSSEHGLVNDDELNIITKGGNYGWPKVQGFCDQRSERRFCRDQQVIEPLYSWTPTLGVCGIDYYDHPAIPEWRNSILMGTLKGNPDIGQRLLQCKLSEDGKSVVAVNDFLAHTFGRLRDVLVLPDGSILVCTSNQEDNGKDCVRPGDDRIILIRAVDSKSPLVKGGN